MIDDATVYRLGADNFRFVGGDEYDGIWLKELADRQRAQGLGQALDRPAAQRRGAGAGEPRDPREGSSGRRRRRPRSRTSAGSASPSGASATYDGIPIVVSRTGYTGELGYEVWCHPSDGPAVWDAIWAAGEEHGLTPLGLEALDMLRIESGLIFAGYEFDDQVDPSRPASASPSTLRRTRTSSGARRSRSGRLIRSARSSASSSRGTRPQATATSSTSAGSASASSRAGRAARC